MALGGAAVIGFAHRGARLEHPDNSLAGFTRALELGARGLETDAWRSADGIVVLDHDGVVRRGWRRRRIADLPAAALPAHLPSLGDLLALPGAADADISIDVKDPAAAPALVAAATRRTWLCHPDAAVLAGWRPASPAVRLVHSTALRRVGPGAAEVAAHAGRLRRAGVDALNLRAPEWRPELVGACHDAGVAAFAWDAQAAATLAGLVAMGVDAVYSDDVATMVRVLAA